MFGCDGKPEAAACMRGENGLHGKIKFFPHCNGTLIVADICGLPESKTNFFALHVHEGEDCRGEGFPNTGSHYNPESAVHPSHAGDLPPLLSCGGKAYLAVVTDRFHIKDVLGKTVVIHSHPDDFKTQPSGGAGRKIGCGVIGRV